MKEIFHLRMQEHELSMRQMVEETHLGQLSIGQAAVRFEVTRQTVKHWLDKVEGEAVKTSDPDFNHPFRIRRKMLLVRQKFSGERSMNLIFVLD